MHPSALGAAQKRNIERRQQLARDAFLRRQEEAANERARKHNELRQRRDQSTASSAVVGGGGAPEHAWESQPVVARGSYDLSFMDQENELEQRHTIQLRHYWSAAAEARLAARERRRQEGAQQRQASSGQMTDEEFEREWSYERLLELDNFVRRRGGLTTAQMGCLPNGPLGEVCAKSVPERNSPSEGENCMVCVEEMGSDDDVYVLGCGHMFHIECIQPWFADHHTCPTCRFDVRAYLRQQGKIKAEEEEEEEGGNAETRPLGEGGSDDEVFIVAEGNTFSEEELAGENDDYDRGSPGKWAQGQYLDDY